MAWTRPSVRVRHGPQYLVLFTRENFLPNKFNWSTVILLVVIIYVLEVAFNCTGLYHMINGNPATPYSVTEIPLRCIGNQISANRWIYPSAAMMIYVLVSFLLGYRKMSK